MHVRLAILGLLCLGVPACGAAEPREADIFHDSALRPSVVQPASDAERAVLSSLAEDPQSDELAVSGQVFRLEPTYYAASGRRCRRVVGPTTRLACETDEGWAFVPELHEAP